MSAGQVVPGRGLLLGRADEVLDVVEVDARQVGAPGRHRLLAEQPQPLEAQVEHPLAARSSAPRCCARRPRTGRAGRWRRRCRSRTSRTRSGPGRRARGGRRSSRDSVESSVSCSVRGVCGRLGACAGRRSCRRRRRGRWSPGAGRGCRAAGAKTSVSASHSCGELAGDVGDRAVVLAELLPRGRPLPAGRGRWRRSRRRRAPRRAPRPARSGSAAVDHRAVARLQLGDPLPGERADRLAPAALGEEPQRAGGQVVVGLVEGVPAGSVTPNSRAGRPRPRDRGAARLAFLDSPSATSASRWRRTAAGVRPRLTASAAAVSGPSRAGCARPGRASVSSTADFTTPVCRYSPVIANSDPDGAGEPPARPAPIGSAGRPPGPARSAVRRLRA